VRCISEEKNGFFFDWISACSPDWPWTHDTLASASCMLGLQVRATILSLKNSCSSHVIETLHPLAMISLFPPALTSRDFRCLPPTVMCYDFSTGRNSALKTSYSLSLMTQKFQWSSFSTFFPAFDATFILAILMGIVIFHCAFNLHFPHDYVQNYFMYLFAICMPHIFFQLWDIIVK
jgi:hypothetical protein